MSEFLSRFRELLLEPWLLLSATSTPLVSAAVIFSSPLLMEDEADFKERLVLFAGLSSSSSMPLPTTEALVGSANELRRLSELVTEFVVELVAARDAARVVMCNGWMVEVAKVLEALTGSLYSSRAWTSATEFPMWLGKLAKCVR